MKIIYKLLVAVESRIGWYRWGWLSRFIDWVEVRA